MELAATTSTTYKVPVTTSGAAIDCGNDSGCYVILYNDSTDILYVTSATATGTSITEPSTTPQTCVFVPPKTLITYKKRDGDRYLILDRAAGSGDVLVTLSGGV